MLKTFIWLIILLLPAQWIYAETCPNFNKVKPAALSSWKAYDSDDNKPLDPKHTASFLHNMNQLSLAEWVKEGPHKGAINCYYSDKNGSVIEAYLSKSDFIPQNKKHFWYPVSGSMHCAAGMEACAFEPKLSHATPTLAKK